MGIWYMRKILLGDDIYNHHTSILPFCCFFLPKLRWTNAVRGWDRNWSWKRFLKFLLHVMTCFLEVGANPCERPWLFWCSRCLVDESSVFTSGTMKSHSPTLLQVWNVRIWREIMCIKGRLTLFVSSDSWGLIVFMGWFATSTANIMLPSSGVLLESAGPSLMIVL